jgi:hypothetical protein
MIIFEEDLEVLISDFCSGVWVTGQNPKANNDWEACWMFFVGSAIPCW